MTREEFLIELQDILQRDEPLESSMLLRELPEWDSMSLITVAGFFDQQFSKSLSFIEFENLITVEDLMLKAGC